MLISPTSSVPLESSYAVGDPADTARAIAMASTGDFSASAQSIAAGGGILSASTTTTATATAAHLRSAPPFSTSRVLSLLDSSGTPQEILGSIKNPEDAWDFSTAALSRVIEILASADPNSDFEPIANNPLAVLSTIALVTASDMIPFVPCQPLAISLAAKHGAWAFPVCVVGQTLAGVLAFQSSRKVSDAETVQSVLESLGEKGKLRFQKFKTQSLLRGSTEAGSDNNAAAFPDDDNNNERTVFLALVGLRLAPFFPFSAGNYLLGGATDVGLRPFVLATILGCMFSNAVSILVGMGGAELLMNVSNN